MKTKKPKRPKPPARKAATTSEDELVFAEVRSGVGAGKEISKKLKNAFGVPYAFLTEEQWEEIQLKAGLRPSARFELNIALRRYWLERLNASIDPKARDAVVEAKQRLDDALESLVGLIVNEGVFKGPVAVLSAYASPATRRTGADLREYIARVINPIFGRKKIDPRSRSTFVRPVVRSNQSSRFHFVRIARHLRNQIKKSNTGR